VVGDLFDEGGQDGDALGLHQRGFRGSSSFRTNFSFKELVGGIGEITAGILIYFN